MAQDPFVWRFCSIRQRVNSRGAAGAPQPASAAGRVVLRPAPSQAGRPGLRNVRGLGARGRRKSCGLPRPRSMAECRTEQPRRPGLHDMRFSRRVEAGRAGLGRVQTFRDASVRRACGMLCRLFRMSTFRARHTRLLVEEVLPGDAGDFFCAPVRRNTLVRAQRRARNNQYRPPVWPADSRLVGQVGKPVLQAVGSADSKRSAKTCCRSKRFLPPPPGAAGSHGIVRGRGWGGPPPTSRKSSKGLGAAGAAVDRARAGKRSPRASRSLGAIAPRPGHLPHGVFAMCSPYYASSVSDLQAISCAFRLWRERVGGHSGARG